MSVIFLSGPIGAGKTAVAREMEAISDDDADPVPLARRIAEGPNQRSFRVV